MRWLLLLAATTSVAHAQSAPCITSFRSAEGVEVRGGAVSFCDDETPKKQKCFAIDLATGKVTSAKRPEPTSTSSGPTLEINGKKAKACAAGRCKTLKPRARVDEGLGMHGNVRGNLVVLVNLGEVETFALKTGKRIGGFTAGNGDCTTVTLVADDVLLVQNRFCGDDEKGTHYFATPKGKRIAVVGGTKPIEVGAPAELGAQVAFVSMKSDEVVVHDVKTGAVARRIPLGNADEAWPAIEGDDKRLVVVFGGARAGDLAVVELATEKVTTHAAKRCE